MPYRVEYDKSGRAGCKGPKPCNGTKILKGSLRFGTVVEISGNTGFQWRHWGCVTGRILTNIKKTCPEPSDVDGYEELIPEDQAKMDRAWAEGFVDPADIPPSAVKAEEDNVEGATPKKAKAKKPRTSKAKAEADEDGEPDEEDAKPKNKKKAAPKKAAPKKKAKKDDSESEADMPDESEEEEVALTPDESEEDYKPANKGKGRASGGGKKKKKKQKKRQSNSDDDEEDDESAEEVIAAPKKRGRPSKVKGDPDADDDAAPPAKKARGRSSKAKSKEQSDEEDVKPDLDDDSE